MKQGGQQPPQSHSAARIHLLAGSLRPGPADATLRLSQTRLLHLHYQAGPQLIFCAFLKMVPSYRFRNAFLTQAEVGRNETRQVRSCRAVSHSGSELCGAPGHTCTELPALVRKASGPVERSPDPVREEGPAPSAGLVSRPGTHRPVTQTHLTWPNHSSHRNDLYFHKEVSPFFGSQWPPWSICFHLCGRGMNAEECLLQKQSPLCKPAHL